MRGVMALILSGGSGEGLGVLCAERAVSALPYGGKYRVIDFVLSNCCHSGLERVAVLAQHAPASLSDHIGAGRAWDFDRRTPGIEMLHPYQTRSHAGWYRGTADAIAQNWHHVEELAPDRVLVLSGDHVYRMDYNALLATHEARGASATLAVARVPSNETHRFGMVTADRNGRVKQLEEKPRHSDAPFGSMGVYVFEREVLGEMIRQQPVDMVLDVVRPLVEAGERIYTHEFSGYWEDVGTVASYHRANLDLVGPEPRLNLYDGGLPVLTRDEERPPVLLGDDALLEDCLVANGCRVHGTVIRSILFPGVHIAPGATVVDSVVMSDTVIESGARVDRAILDKYVRVGERAVVGAGEAAAPPQLEWLSGLVLVGKDSWIPPGGQVERPAQIGIGGRYEDFEGGRLPAGTLVPSRRWFEELRT